MISRMTEELAGILGQVKRKRTRRSAPKNAFPGSRYRFIRKWNKERSDDVRFPWIHKSEPEDFHSSKRLPRKNQVAVPWC